MSFTPVTYKGKSYKSISALCRVYDIDDKRVRSRLYSGWELEDAVETAIGEKVTNGIRIEYEGVYYKSLKSMAKELELSVSLLQHEYYRTKDINKAVEYCLSHEEEPIVVWGKTYNSISEVGSVFGISSYNLYKQVRVGKDIQSVVKKALETESILFKGKKYNHFADLCAEYQIQPSNVYARLGYGMDLEEALTKPIKKNRTGTKVYYDGIEYESKTELCRAYGISVLCIREQVKAYDISFIEAFEAVRELKEQVGIGKEELVNYIPCCRIRGKSYKTIVEVLRKFNITDNTFYTVKYKGKYDDVFDVLKKLQTETRCGYIVNGKKIPRVDIKKLGYTAYKISKLPKCTCIKYPKLKDFDLSTDCFDIKKIYSEIIKKLKEKEHE